jgi:hypothetical protein
MRFRTVALAAGLSVGLTQTTDAFLHKGADRPSSRTDSRRLIAVTFVTTNLGSWPRWLARDLGQGHNIPARLWGESVAPARWRTAIAESFARSFLAQHLSLLAPGAQVTDFVLVSNSSAASAARSASSSFGGLQVLGRPSFAFKNDRMIMVDSTALRTSASRRRRPSIRRGSASPRRRGCPRGRATSVTNVGNP